MVVSSSRNPQSEKMDEKSNGDTDTTSSEASGGAQVPLVNAESARTNQPVGPTDSSDLPSKEAAPGPPSKEQPSVSAQTSSSPSPKTAPSEKECSSEIDQGVPDTQKSASKGSENDTNAEKKSSGQQSSEESSVGSSKSTNGTTSSKKEKASLRKGKWTVEEEEYTSRIIQLFSTGFLTLPEGHTLRSYLAEKLNCDPMRITKKFTGACCLGRRVYHLRDRPQPSPAEVEIAKAELNHLEQRFRLRLEHEQSGVPLTRQQELLLAQPPASRSSLFYGQQRVPPSTLAPPQSWFQNFSANSMTTTGHDPTTPLANPSNAILSQIAPAIASSNGWAGGNLLDPTSQWSMNNQAQAAAPAPMSIGQRQQPQQQQQVPPQQAALQALNRLVNTLAMGQVATSLNPALSQLAGSNVQQQYQQELREAFERQLNTQAGPGNNSMNGSAGLNLISSTNGTSALSPAEQLQRSYQAHLEALKAQSLQSNTQEGRNDCPPSSQNSSATSNKTLVATDSNFEATSKKTKGNSTPTNSKTKNQISSKKKGKSKKKKDGGGDEEASSILLLLRKSYEDARNNGSSSTSSDEGEKNEMKEDTVTDLSYDATKEKKKEPKKATSNKPVVKSTSGSSSDEAKRSVENSVTARRKRSLPSTENSIKPLPSTMVRPMSVVTDTSTLSRSETSSGTSSQPNESSSSMDNSDDSKSESSTSDQTSSEESEKGPSEGSLASKGPPRKRHRTAKTAQNFTAQNLLQHSQRLENKLKQPE